jgi:hypothetical protein
LSLGPLKAGSEGHTRGMRWPGREAWDRSFRPPPKGGPRPAAGGLLHKAGPRGGGGKSILTSNQPRSTVREGTASDRARPGPVSPAPPRAWAGLSGRSFRSRCSYQGRGCSFRGYFSRPPQGRPKWREPGGKINYHWLISSDRADGGPERAGLRWPGTTFSGRFFRPFGVRPRGRRGAGRSQGRPEGAGAGEKNQLLRLISRARRLVGDGAAGLKK